MESLNDKPSVSWFQKGLEAIVIPIASTAFELLLFGFSTFFPAYYFKIEHPIIIYFQIATVSVTEAFFQGCRSLGYLSYFRKLEGSFPKYPWLSGAISTIPLNLIALAFFGLYSQNPNLDPTEAKYVWPFAVLLIGLNFVVGAWGSQMQYKAMEQNRPKGAMGLFYPAAILMVLGWMIIFLIMIFVLRLNISLRFPR